MIVYNTASGQSHLLDALSGAILKEIERGPSTIEQLADRLAKEFSVEPHALLERLDEICTHFDELGLAEPEPS